MADETKDQVPEENSVANDSEKDEAKTPFVMGEVTVSKNQKHFSAKPFLILLVLLIAVIAVGFLYTKYADKNSKSQVTNPSKVVVAKKVSKSVPDSINPIDETKIPMGVNKYSDSAKSGYVYSCQANYSNDVGGADVAGPWIDATNNTWDSTKKVVVSGAVSWPTASYKVEINGDKRAITANDLPINGQTTGTFPIASSDPAHQFDKNPNKIAEQTVSLSLPLNPTAAGSPSCANGGAIGILSDGVVLFNALDGQGRDAAAYETLDSCDGHPERSSEYHHHDIPSCILNNSKKRSSSILVGYANDGYGIYVERDKEGKILTNANLDECHGRTSKVMWDKQLVDIYHYDATIEFPYTVGCFHGTTTVTQTQAAAPQVQAPPRGSEQQPPR